MLRVRYQKAKIQTANKKPGGGLAPRRAFEFGAGNETRTRDPDLGNVIFNLSPVTISPESPHH
jgi:hypothetical protein